MGLFSRKPTVSVEEFCREFYDSQVFHAIIAGEDAAQVLWEHVFTSVAEADRSFFASVDGAVFRREMTALRLELFGLAWMRCKIRDKHRFPQSFFTRDYLYQAGRKEIWDIMGDYNEAIASSSQWDSTGNRRGRGRLTFMNEFRFKSMESMAKDSHDQEYLVCVARVCNRLFTGGLTTKGVPVGSLSHTLVERLGCDPDHLTSEAAFRLMAVIFGLYRGAKEAIQSVDIQA